MSSFSSCWVQGFAYRNHHLPACVVPKYCNDGHTSATRRRCEQTEKRLNGRRNQFDSYRSYKFYIGCSLLMHRKVGHLFRQGRNFLVSASVGTLDFTSESLCKKPLPPENRTVDADHDQRKLGYFEDHDHELGVSLSHSMCTEQHWSGSRVNNISSSEQKISFNEKKEKKVFNNNFDILSPDSNRPESAQVITTAASVVEDVFLRSQGSRFGGSGDSSDKALVEVEQFRRSCLQPWKDSRNAFGGIEAAGLDAALVGLCIAYHQNVLQNSKATRRNLLQHYCIPSIFLPLGLRLPHWLHSLSENKSLKADARQQVVPVLYTVGREAAFDPASWGTSTGSTIAARKDRVVRHSCNTVDLGYQPPYSSSRHKRCLDPKSVGLASGRVVLWGAGSRIRLIVNDNTEQQPRSVFKDALTMIGLLAFVVSGTWAFAISYRYLQPWNWLQNLDLTAAKYYSTRHGKEAPDPVPANATSIDKGESDIGELTDGTFVGFVQIRPTFVFFYATWCPFCQVLDTTWVDLANALKRAGYEVQLARMNAEKNPITADNYKVKKYPSFIFFRDGGVPAENGRYLGPRNVDSFMKFIEEKLHHQT